MTRPNTKMMFQNTKVTPQNTKHQEMLVQIYTKGCTKYQGERKKTENGYFRTKNSKIITFLEILERETAILERMKEIKVAKRETWGEQKKNGYCLM